MQTFRQSNRIARFLLVWFALSLGAAMASPWVKPKGMQMVCSGGGMQLVALDDAASGDASKGLSYTMDCPLCGVMTTLLSTGDTGFSADLPAGLADMPGPQTAPSGCIADTHPPARAPPLSA